MRQLGAIAIGSVILLTLCMQVALIGRAWDWSPFALVVLGALLGFSFATGLILFLYATGEDGEA